jgi:hypothetical protein
MGRPILFVCPDTKLSIQHWLGNGDDVPKDEYESVDCPACAKIRFINRKTSKLMGGEDQ